MLICQMTDLHVRPRGVACNRVSETNMLTERACRVVAGFKPRPDVLLITGDLTECGLPAEYDNLADILKRTLSLPIMSFPATTIAATICAPGWGICHMSPAIRISSSTRLRITRCGWSCWIPSYPARLTAAVRCPTGMARPHPCGAAVETDFAGDAPSAVRQRHPAYGCDRAAQPERFTAVIARHGQVRQIVCGHHHRPIVGRCAQAIASIAPSVAHQVELSFDPADGGAFNFEPAAVQLHRWDPADGFVSHTIYTGTYAGPFPFLTEPDYPGAH